MEHPQPAFEFLLSLPRDSPPAENIFVDWYVRIGEAEKSDNIRDYPEIWNIFELPEALAGLDSDDVVAIQTFEGSLNLNAIAIGLGLENIKYKPEQFPPLVYDHSDNVVVFVWPSDVIVSVAKASGDTSGVAAGIEQLVDWLHSLGLTDDIQFDNAITTHHVSNIIS